jgi:hypothetical protein
MAKAAHSHQKQARSLRYFNDFCQAGYAWPCGRVFVSARYLAKCLARCLARELQRVASGPDQRHGLVLRFLKFSLRITVIDDAGASLDMKLAILHKSGAKSDTSVEIAGGGNIADRP